MKRWTRTAIIAPAAAGLVVGVGVGVGNATSHDAVSPTPPATSVPQVIGTPTSDVAQQRVTATQRVTVQQQTARPTSVPAVVAPTAAASSQQTPAPTTPSRDCDGTQARDRDHLQSRDRDGSCDPDCADNNQQQTQAHEQHHHGDDS